MLNVSVCLHLDALFVLFFFFSFCASFLLMGWMYDLIANLLQVQNRTRKFIFWLNWVWFNFNYFVVGAFLGLWHVGLLVIFVTCICKCLFWILEFIVELFFRLFQLGIVCWFCSFLSFVQLCFFGWIQIFLLNVREKKTYFCYNA